MRGVIITGSITWSQVDPPRLFFFFTLVTGPTRSLSLKLSDARVYEPQIRARLGTTCVPALSARCHHIPRLLVLSTSGLVLRISDPGAQLKTRLLSKTVTCALTWRGGVHPPGMHPGMHRGSSAQL